MKQKILFKKDSKGKDRVWKIWIEGSKIVQESGLVDGKQVRNEKIAKGKNIGKSNETSPEEQAILEAESTYQGKLTEGYFKTLKEANTKDVILPMLAKDYKLFSHKIDWGNDVFVQPKLDGMRCLSIIKNGVITLKSRDGKIINPESTAHITKDLQNIKADTILDGELYLHGQSFQENMRLIKKYRPSESEQIKYCVYDLIDDNNDMDFITRSGLLGTIIKLMPTIELVETDYITCENDLKRFHKEFLTQGYEGSIVRWGNVPYKINGRSENLLKYKDFMDIAMRIIDVIPSEQRPTWGQFVFQLNGKEFSCGMKFSHAEREEILKNKKDYIGKVAELRYFELSEDKIPRFPVCVGIREDLNK